MPSWGVYISWKTLKRMHLYMSVIMGEINMDEQERIRNFQQTCDVMILPFFKYSPQPDDSQRCVEGAYAKNYRAKPPNACLNLENPSLELKMEFDDDTDCKSGRFSFEVWFPETEDIVKKSEQIVGINNYLKETSLDADINKDKVYIAGPFNYLASDLHVIIENLQTVDSMVRVMYDNPE